MSRAGAMAEVEQRNRAKRRTRIRSKFKAGRPIRVRFIGRGNGGQA